MPRTKKASFKVIATSSIALSLALTLTGCAAGQNAASRTIKQVTDGVELSIQDDGVDIEVLNLLLVATETGDAVVVGTIVNQGDTEDQLLGIAVGSNQAVLTGESLLKKNQPVRFEGDTANAKAVFYGVSPAAGRHVTLSLGFARAGLVTAEVIIRDKRDDYRNVTSGTLAPAEINASPDSQPLQ
jgi:hypothetical protein